MNFCFVLQFIKDQMPTGTVVVIAAHASVWWSEEESNIKTKINIQQENTIATP